jgi:hypothetical protein
LLLQKHLIFPKVVWLRRLPFGDFIQYLQSMEACRIGNHTFRISQTIIS